MPAVQLTRAITLVLSLTLSIALFGCASPSPQSIETTGPDAEITFDGLHRLTFATGRVGSEKDSTRRAQLRTRMARFRGVDS